MRLSKIKLGWFISPPLWLWFHLLCQKKSTQKRKILKSAGWYALIALSRFEFRKTVSALGEDTNFCTKFDGHSVWREGSNDIGHFELFQISMQCIYFLKMQIFLHTKLAFFCSKMFSTPNSHPKLATLAVFVNFGRK